MFDKPNTAGFLHVSHYLSIIYDATFFKQMVRWPILCKRDEATYRIEMKNFLSILSRDNPDINFPPILMSHLIQSGGIKFLIIMWKLSQVALRTYIKRECKRYDTYIFFFRKSLQQFIQVELFSSRRIVERTMSKSNGSFNYSIF